MKIQNFVVVLAVLLTSSTAFAETPAELTERLLTAGKLGEADAGLSRYIKEHPGDDVATFGLGVTRFLAAVEHLSQSFHRYGLRSGMIGNVVPFARLPIPTNTDPEPIGYEDLRKIMQTVVVDLSRAEATLAQVGDGEVKLPLHFGRIRLDLDGNGEAGPDERLWKLYAVLNRAAGNQVTAEQGEAFVIAFDRGDVAWLRGYCHLLLAFAEVYLAHDSRELFEHTAPLFFRRAETPYPFLLAGENPPEDRNRDNILDAVAMIHLIRLPVIEPARMKSALAHLESMIALSRESWKHIIAETDNDHEWIPNTHQRSVLPNGAVNMEMIKGWMTFLGEAEQILKGKMLIPFWRGKEKRGINLRRVFTEPTTFDLVLWVQGTQAQPYLEEGPLTKPETWRRLQNVFRGEFIGFALWFN